MIELIYVDGSGKAAGLAHHDRRIAFPIEDIISTNWAEMLALVLGIKYCYYNKIQHAVIHTDSKVAEAIVRNQYSDAEHLNNQCRAFHRILKKCQKIGLKIEVQWIQGKTNPADAPSRLKGEYEDGWTLDFPFIK